MREFKVIAIATVNKSVWVGINSRKTHPKSIKRDDNVLFSNQHAEFDVLKRIPYHLRKRAKIYVFRFKKNGVLAIAKPCKDCENLILSAGLNPKRVYYTDINGAWQCLKP